MSNEKIYAVYKGDELQFHGTKKEIAEALYLSEQTVKSYATPGHLKKTKGKNRLRLVEVRF